MAQITNPWNMSVTNMCSMVWANGKVFRDGLASRMVRSSPPLEPSFSNWSSSHEVRPLLTAKYKSPFNRYNTYLQPYNFSVNCNSFYVSTTWSFNLNRRPPTPTLRAHVWHDVADRDAMFASRQLAELLAAARLLKRSLNVLTPSNVSAVRAQHLAHPMLRQVDGRLFCLFGVLTCVACVLRHAQAPEEAGLQRPALRQEEGLAGPQRDQRDRQRQLT